MLALNPGTLMEALDMRQVRLDTLKPSLEFAGFH